MHRTIGLTDIIGR